MRELRRARSGSIAPQSAPRYSAATDCTASTTDARRAGKWLATRWSIGGKYARIGEMSLSRNVEGRRLAMADVLSVNGGAIAVIMPAGPGGGTMKTAASLLSLLLLTTAVDARAETPCDELKSLRLADATVMSSQSYAAAPLQSNAPQSPANAGPVLPAHCRVAVTLKPSSDSDIKVEVWLPVRELWNGKYLAVGGGGFVGSLNYGAMSNALLEGYATSSTDTGHVGGTADFALGHPEKVVDFAYRAVHEMTVKAKAIITAHYGRSTRLSYWTGCSTGGRQGLMEAQRYPEDFDGIIAGAPANNQAKLSGWRLRLEMEAFKDPANVVPRAKLTLLNKAVVAACDALDGVEDGLLTDPRRCRFDPAALTCRGDSADDCLTERQVEMVKMAYAPGVKNNGELIYPGLVPGGETGWALLSNPNPERNAIDYGIYAYVVHQDRGWDWRTFDLERDTQLADERVGYNDAINPDLGAFKARGGKLLIYHGWNDGGSAGAISPLNTLDYYSSVLAKMGRNQDSWLRVFMVPGMAHCGGGPGPNQFNALGALERWREAGSAPDRIIASRVTNNRVDMTRPLCPYPRVAVYTGIGATNDAGNFVCEIPPAVAGERPP